jgi:hypothetical protein
LDFIAFVDEKKYHGRDLSKNVDVRLLSSKYESMKWNLTKLFMFSKESGLQKYEWVICLDLDMVITGSVDFLLDHRWEGLITCSGAYQPDQLGGSIIGFRPGSPWCGRITQTLRDKPCWWEKMTAGSERKFYRIFFGMDPELVSTWQEQFPGKILSYKVDGKPKDDCSIIRFHGRPRPHEVANQLDWMKENWR